MTEATLGRLEIICGPMFSGKTTELIRRIEEARNFGFTTRAIKPTTDTRYSALDLVTHTGQRIQASAAMNAAEILAIAKEFPIEARMKVIAIDEAHFFAADLSQVCVTLLSWDFRVIVVGLEFDHRGDVFDPFPTLFNISHNITRLVGLCAVCGCDAIHTQRMIDSKERIVVGGVGDYEPRCVKCFAPSRG
ncbi:MAG: thymidine kinase [Planctomycetota bacterium]|nr:thymidine kinase [Planctomycetota bacterium]MDA1261654.1 thymidine kinase [Planctomycetota bacterium]